MESSRAELLLGVVPVRIGPRAVGILWPFPRSWEEGGVVQVTPRTVERTRQLPFVAAGHHRNWHLDYSELGQTPAQAELVLQLASHSQQLVRRPGAVPVGEGVHWGC